MAEWDEQRSYESRRGVDEGRGISAPRGHRRGRIMRPADLFGEPPSEIGRIFLGRLREETNEEKLKTALEAFGKILDLRVIFSNRSGHVKRFAFCDMESQAAATAAITALHGDTELGYPSLVVTPSTDPVPEHPAQPVGPTFSPAPSPMGLSWQPPPVAPPPAGPGAPLPGPRYTYQATPVLANPPPYQQKPQTPQARPAAAAPAGSATKGVPAAGLSPAGRPPPAGGLSPSIPAFFPQMNLPAGDMWGAHHQQVYVLDPNAQTTLHIKGLPNYMDEMALLHYFMPFGCIVCTKILRSEVDGGSLGSGFVEFTNRASAELAQRSTDQTKWPGGRIMRVSFADRQLHLSSASPHGAMWTMPVVPSTYLPPPPPPPYPPPPAPTHAQHHLQQYHGMGAPLQGGRGRQQHQHQLPQPTEPPPPPQSHAQQHRGGGRGHQYAPQHSRGSFNGRGRGGNGGSSSNPGWNENGPGSAIPPRRMGDPVTVVSTLGNHAAFPRDTAMLHSQSGIAGGTLGSYRTAGGSTPISVAAGRSQATGGGITTRGRQSEGASGSGAGIGRLERAASTQSARSQQAMGSLVGGKEGGVEATSRPGSQPLSRAVSGPPSDVYGSSGAGSEREGQQQGQPQLKSKRKGLRRKKGSRPETSAERSSAEHDAEEVQGSSDSTQAHAAPAAAAVPAVPATSFVESTDSCAVSVVAKGRGRSPGGDTVASETAEEEICSGLRGVALDDERAH